MRAAAVVFSLLLLGNETSLADDHPGARMRLPATAADHHVAIRSTDKIANQHKQKIQASTPNGKCSSRSGVPKVRALALLPNERAQCTYFVAQGL